MKTLSRLTLVVLLSATLTSAHAFLGLGWPIPTDKDVIFQFGKSGENALPQRMNILVWNLHKGGDATFAHDFNELAYQKDLLINEEMQLDLNMRTVFAAFPDNFYTTATSFFVGKDLFRTGVATGSEVTPTETSYIKTVTLEPIMNSPKVTLITRYPIHNSTKQLTVVNIHGINFVDNTSYKKEIDRIANVIKDIPSPLILAGDFNSWNEVRLEILKEAAEKLHLTEANFFPDNRLRFHGSPLDHFYYTDDIRVLETKVEAFYQGSDHKPLELVIEYSPLLNQKKKH